MSDVSTSLRIAPRLLLPRLGGLVLSLLLRLAR
jgi:hypothetical protein